MECFDSTETEGKQVRALGHSAKTRKELLMNTIVIVSPRFSLTGVARTSLDGVALFLKGKGLIFLESQASVGDH